MPVKAAAREFKVPRTTLQRRAKGQSGEKLGGPTVLSAAEEKEIVARMILFGEWGFPLTTVDLRNMVKSYLDTVGKATRFLFGQYSRVFFLVINDFLKDKISQIKMLFIKS